MKMVIVIMTLMGCDDAGAACEVVKVAEDRYATITACEQASQAMIEREWTGRYPVLMVACEPQLPTGSAGAAPALSPVVPARPARASLFDDIPGYRSLEKAAGWVSAGSIRVYRSTTSLLREALPDGLD